MPPTSQLVVAAAAAAAAVASYLYLRRWKPVMANMLSTGSYKLANRKFHVLAANKEGRRPVLILLHGGEGTGKDMLMPFRHAPPGSPISKVAETHVIVAPDGTNGNWNVNAQPTAEDDVGFVACTLLNHVCGFSNVQPVAKLFGFSNGAALTHRILIETSDGRITAAITDGSQLNTHQFHANAFHVGGRGNQYEAVQPKLSRRALLSIVGGNDDIIPALGGPCSFIPSGTSDDHPCGSAVTFLHWRASAHAYAVAHGHEGDEAAAEAAAFGIERVSYLNGLVQGALVPEAGHGALFGSFGALDTWGGKVQAQIAEFLGA